MYTGRRLDEETGLYYYRARHYSPALKRFVQRDPLEYVDGPNPFAYVEGRPTAVVDPYGLFGGLPERDPGSEGGVGRMHTGQPGCGCGCSSTEPGDPTPQASEPDPYSEAVKEADAAESDAHAAREAARVDAENEKKALANRLGVGESEWPWATGVANGVMIGVFDWRRRFGGDEGGPPDSAPGDGSGPRTPGEDPEGYGRKAAEEEAAGPYGRPSDNRVNVVKEIERQLRNIRELDDELRRRSEIWLKARNELLRLLDEDKKRREPTTPSGGGSEPPTDPGDSPRPRRRAR
jgi:RHS repeat-associated protein